MYAKPSSDRQLLVNAREAARMLSISEKTLWSLSQPRGPIPVVRVGMRSVRYSVIALEKAIAARKIAVLSGGTTADRVLSNRAAIEKGAARG
jgi:hypothetical protein